MVAFGSLVAREIAFETAEGTTAAVGSPAPHGFSVGRSINSITIFRKFRKRKDRVACPTKAGYHASIKCDLFLQSTADGLDNISFDLGPNSIRIDDLSAIMNDIDFCYSDVADRPVHFYFDDAAYLGAHKFVFDVTDPGPFTILPVMFFSGDGRFCQFDSFAR